MDHVSASMIGAHSKVQVYYINQVHYKIVTSSNINVHRNVRMYQANRKNVGWEKRKERRRDQKINTPGKDDQSFFVAVFAFF